MTQQRDLLTEIRDLLSEPEPANEAETPEDPPREAD